MTDDTVKVAAVAMHSKMADPRANLARVDEWARKARAQGAVFALFTEECITGSMNKSDLTPERVRRVAEEAQQISLPFLERLASELDMTLIVGTIEPVEGGLRNSAYIVGPEGHLATFSKLHLPGNRERLVPRGPIPARSHLPGVDLLRRYLLRREVPGAVPHRLRPRRRLLPAGRRRQRNGGPGRPRRRPGGAG